MEKRAEGEQGEPGGELKKRLKGVRKRKYAQRRFGRDVLAFKMRLVKTKVQLDY